MAVVEHVLRLRQDVSDELDDVAKGADRAEKSLDGVQSGLDKVGKGADRAADKLDKAGEAAESMEDRAGRADSILQGMAGALELVDPKLAEAARGAGDLAGGFEAVARLGGSALNILGPVGLAVGALALVWRELAQEVEEAEQRMRDASDEATRAMELRDRVLRTQVRAQVARGELSQEEGTLRLATLDAEAQYAERRAAVEERLNASAAQRRDLEREIAGIRANREAGLASSEDLQRLDAAKSELNQVEAAFSTAEREATNLNAAVANLTSDLVDIATATRAAEGAAKAHAAAMKDEATAAAAVSAVASAVAADEGLVPGGGVVDVFGLLAQRRRERAVAPTVGAYSSDGYGGIDAIGYGDQLQASLDADAQRTAELAAEAAAQEAADRAARREQAASIANPIIGGLGAFAAGNPAALLGGPVGGALSLFAGLGSTGVDPATGEPISPEEQARQQLEGFKTAVLAGVEALPAIIGDVIPDFIKTFIPALVEELPGAIVQSILAAFEAVWEIITGFFRELFSIGEELTPEGRKQVKRASKQLNSELEAASSAGTFGSTSEYATGPVPVRHAGGFSDTEQLALLQVGETVVPRDGAATSRVRQVLGGGSMGEVAAGGGIQVHIHGNVMGPDSAQWVVEEIRRAFGTFGPAAGAPVPWGA